MQNKTTKQQLLLEYLISSVDTFALCKSIVKPEYFDPELRKSVEFIHEYYDKYSAIPTPDQISAETDVAINRHQITHDQISYCSDEIEQFCRRKAMQQAVIQSSKYIEKDDYGTVETLVRDALAVSLNRDLGVDYFNKPIDRLERLTLQPLRTPTKWKAFDDMLNGGIARKEILLFSANSGGGKSITLANLAVNMLEQGFNVLYLSLELSEDLIAQRFDTMFTGIPSVVSQQKYKDIAASLNELAPHMGKMNIKHMSTGTTSNQIRSYLKEFELKFGYLPDLLIVDYLDIMGANEKVSADNVWEKDKRAAEQLRDIAFDYNMYIATASQQNRSAIDAQELNQSHIAGGLSKVNTVDIYASIIMTPTMKAAGEIGFSFLKTRNSDGVGKTIYMRWENKTLRILNKTEGVDDDGVLVDREPIRQGGGSGKPKRSLLDIMNT